ncbi:MAG TPA: hypothetical protein VFQ09_05405 [Rubrobacter sp.]|nr:hypothetical protein [Rubrobacter sp.]HYQ82863.1 hypothetical protein [Rubrobacter sp.]
MRRSQTHHSREEFARRGDEIYDRVVAPRLKEDDLGKFVLLDIDSEDYEIDQDELAASDRLLARNPGAQVWFTRAGSRYARRFGGPRRWLPPA